MASGGIYLLSGKDLVELAETAYESEALLQGYLDDYPKLLAGEQIDPSDPRQWLLIRREAPVPDSEGGGGRWAVDHLFVDQSAIPTLVEVKRSTDSRIRREVVGQMLDYAANAIAYWPIDYLISEFEKTCEQRGADPDEAIRSLTDGEMEPDEYWKQVQSNLHAGRVRMIFVADVIPRELQRIVEFLNEQLDRAEVYAVEVTRYSNGDTSAFVPRLIGATAQAQQQKRAGRSRTTWTTDTFLEALSEKSKIRNSSDVEPNMRAAKRTVEWARQAGLELAGGEGAGASLKARVTDNAGSHPMFYLYDYGRITVPLGSLHPPYDTTERRRELFNDLNESLGDILPATDVDHSQPSFDLRLLAEQATFEAFARVWEGFVAAHRNSR